MRWVVVAVPGDKRSHAFAAALRATTAADEPLVVPWLEVIADPYRLAGLLRAGDVLRIESPGGDDATWLALASQAGPTEPVPAGRWRPGRAWAAGLASVLRRLAVPAGVLLMNAVADIIAMTDKLVCRERLAAFGVAVPPGLAAPDHPDALRTLLAAQGWTGAFIKPRWGSSGAGVVALRCDGHAPEARACIRTTAVLDGDGLRNSKRLVRYERRSDIDRVLAPILADGAVVERWIPKQCTDGGPVDLRVLMIAGEPRQRIARVGSGPITNLHLDARRLAPDVLLARAPAGTGDALWSLCRRAAAAFPASLYLGLDVLLDQRWRPLVVEANAWGDHLPRLTDRGLDTYGAEIAALGVAQC